MIGAWWIWTLPSWGEEFDLEVSSLQQNTRITSLNMKKFKVQNSLLQANSAEEKVYRV